MNLPIEVGSDVTCISGSIAKMFWGKWFAHDHCKQGELFKVIRKSADHIQLLSPEGETTHFFHPISKFQNVQQEVVPVTSETVSENEC